METAYDGRQVVGMDLHRRRSVLVRMTEDGRRLGTVRIANSPAELRAQIALAGVNPKVVLEAMYGWYWAADTLAETGAEVHLAHPLGVKAFTYRRVKNDERDAADLADLLRMGRLAEAWIAPAEVRELRELTRYRAKLVSLRPGDDGHVDASPACRRPAECMTPPPRPRAGRGPHRAGPAAGIQDWPSACARACVAQASLTPAIPATRAAAEGDHDRVHADQRAAADSVPMTLILCRLAVPDDGRTR